ncbi:MAG: hypothetical protein DWQ34_00615 [Planctomycetota bacterium]|nr:MAG: hypothetical protein DWQ34_00615 [Planctomycetota bacterium]REK31633.1 MAG: hypothetical protein DWQ45_18650 [Planctomycetota bacterium]
MRDIWGTLTTRPGTRFLAFDGVVVVLLGAENAAAQRAEVLENAAGVASRFTKLVTTPDVLQNLPEAALAEVHATSELFAQLQSEGLMNDRLLAYKTEWEGEYRPAIFTGNVGPAVFSGVHLFYENLAFVNDENKCTTYVTGAKGAGATVQYAEPADARRDNWLEAPTPTMVTLELDRGFYMFRLLRNGAETGRMGPVDCDHPSQGVEVPE